MPAPGSFPVLCRVGARSVGPPPMPGEHTDAALRARTPRHGGRRDRRAGRDPKE